MTDTLPAGNEPILLAFSGGLDTSFLVPWLKETYGRPIITVTVDTGGIDADAAKVLDKRAKELGAKDPDPTTALREGIDQILATPELEGEIEVIQPKVYYEFADPKVESLKPLQKQLLRMGPHNIARIKGYLTQVKGHL